MELKLFVILMLVGYVVCSLPIIGVYFRCIITMYHENGHGLISLLTFGKVKRIDIFSSTAGLISYRTKNKFTKMLVSVAGYPFASFATLTIAYLYLKGEHEVIMYVLIGTIIINLLLWVRNFYGILWLIVFGLMLGSTYYYIPELNTKMVELILAVMMYENIYTAFVVMKLSFKDSKNAGDATSMKESTYIPAQVWGILFFVQAVLMTLFILKVEV